jgi:hypothetical protein
MAQPKSVVKVEFDRTRKLKAKHRHLRDAVRVSGKSITDLIADPFGGFPYLVQALLQPSANVGENITLDKASDLLDVYFEKGGTVEQLQKALVETLSSYLQIEITPTADEEEETGSPNADSPDAPGPVAG